MNDDTKPTAKIFELPNVDRRDLGTKAKSVDVLQAALDYGITDVIVLGMERDGSRYCASEDGNMDAVTGKLFTAATFLANHRVTHNTPPEKDKA